MALSNSSLKTGLEAMFNSHPADATAAANAWAAAYRSYASSAQSPIGGAPVSLASAETLLASTLAPVFAARGTAASTASALAAAFTVFWLTPPITFTGGTPGIVTAVGGTSALQSALLAAWANNVATLASVSDAAQSMADALHAFTITVIVTHTYPFAAVGPIS